MGHRNVAIGASVIGSAVVTGDHNVTNVRYRKVTLPPAESVDIRRTGGAARSVGRPEQRGSAEDRQRARRGEIAPHVQNAVAWLGENWRKLLPLVGLAA